MRMLLTVALLGIIGLAISRFATAGNLFPDSYMIEKRTVGERVLEARRVTEAVSCTIEASLSAVNTDRHTAVVAVTIREEDETSMAHTLSVKEELVILCPVADMITQLVLTSVHADGSASFEQHTYIHADKERIRRFLGS